MQSLGKFRLNVSRILGGVATGLLLAGVACGAAATATPRPTATPQPPAAQGATPTPTPAARPAVTPTATASPTLIPVTAPAVSPGKVTTMVGTFGNERFDSTFGSPGREYMRKIHDMLISTDVKDGQRITSPGIATGWAISSDGLTWTLTIRKGVKFHDGTEVTAEDVLWTLRHTTGPQARDYATGTISVNFSIIMDRIEQTGPDRVSLTFKVPAPDLLGDISEAGPGSFGHPLPKRATLHDLPEEAAYDRNPIGAGLMRLVKHVPADSMTLERFADYYQQPKNGFPADKRVNFTLLDLRLVPEEATRVAALRAGEVDIAPVSLQARKQVEAVGGRLVFGREGGTLSPFQHGCWKPQFPCHDRRVRQALNYAIDKELIRDRLYGGPEVMQITGWDAISLSTIGYSPELDPFPFDPVKARQLLAEAGYPGGKGFGKLVVNTSVSLSTPLQPESAQLGAEFWRRELGLDVEVKVWEQTALSNAWLRTDEGLPGQVVWGDQQTRIDASGVMRRWYLNPHRGGPAARLHNDSELFAVMQQALAVFDPVERQKALNSAYRRTRDEAYHIPIGQFNIPWGVGPRIRTWEPYPLAVEISALHTITLK